MDEKWYLEKIRELEDSVGTLTKINRKLYDMIVSLGSEMIDLKRFYLAFRISQCKDCKSIGVLNWESPITFRALSFHRVELCEKHQKELDEFNRKHASD